MPLKSCDVDEWYPVFSLSEPGGPGSNAEFTEAEIADYERVMREFDEWQFKIRERIKSIRL